MQDLDSDLVQDMGLDSRRGMEAGLAVRCALVRREMEAGLAVTAPRSDLDGATLPVTNDTTLRVAHGATLPVTCLSVTKAAAPKPIAKLAI